MVMRADGCSQRAVARCLGRSPSTISRELARNASCCKLVGNTMAANAVFFWDLGANEGRQPLCKGILQAYETASHAWVSRVQAEVAMWSDFTTKLAATRSAPEALDACSKCVPRQMQMAAEDGRRLFAEGQKITQRINRSLTSEWPAGST